MSERPSVFVTRVIPEEGLAAVRGACEMDLWTDELPPPRDELLRRVAGRDGVLTLLTDRVDAGFLPCNSFVSAGSDALMVAQAGRRSFVGKLAERALALFRPQPLHAATLVLPGGLGGLTSNFTDFRAVDPGNAVADRRTAGHSGTRPRPTDGA